jgi:hypothetical protein
MIRPPDRSRSGALPPRGRRGCDGGRPGDRDPQGPGGRHPVPPVPLPGPHRPPGLGARAGPAAFPSSQYPASPPSPVGGGGPGGPGGPSRVGRGPAPDALLGRRSSRGGRRRLPAPGRDPGGSGLRHQEPPTSEVAGRGVGTVPGGPGRSQAGREAPPGTKRGAAAGRHGPGGVPAPVPAAGEGHHRGPPPDMPVPRAHRGPPRGGLHPAPRAPRGDDGEPQASTDAEGVPPLRRALGVPAGGRRYHG